MARKYYRNYMLSERKELEKKGITDQGFIHLLIEEKIREYQKTHKGNKPFRCYENSGIFQRIENKSFTIDGKLYLYV